MTSDDEYNYYEHNIMELEPNEENQEVGVEEPETVEKPTKDEPLVK